MFCVNKYWKMGVQSPAPRPRRAPWATSQSRGRPVRVKYGGDFVYPMAATVTRREGMTGTLKRSGKRNAGEATKTNPLRGGFKGVTETETVEVLKNALFIFIVFKLH